MPGAGIFLFIILMMAFGIAIWVMSMGLDKSRITEYVHGRGGRVVSINWAPFGKGWFGEKNDRIYEVVYYDATGNQHFATCKTSFWAGVYWTDDRVTHRKSRWYDSLSPMNEPGNPIIKQISEESFEEEPIDESPAAKRPADERITGRRPAKSNSRDITTEEPADVDDELQRLRAENARLRQQLDRRDSRD